MESWLIITLILCYVIDLIFKILIVGLLGFPASGTMLFKWYVFDELKTQEDVAIKIAAWVFPLSWIALMLTWTAKQVIKFFKEVSKLPPV